MKRPIKKLHKLYTLPILEILGRILGVAHSPFFCLVLSTDNTSTYYFKQKNQSVQTYRVTISALVCFKAMVRGSCRENKNIKVKTV